MDKQQFVPQDFAIPAGLETEQFRLRMLSVGDVEKDYEAVMETQGRFLSLGYDWPRVGFTIEENLADLEGHQQEFLSREAFAYTVVSPDESRVVGCVYINPAKEEGIDARIRMWVRESEYQKGLDPLLFRAVQEWIEKEWPFEEVSYPEREFEARELIGENKVKTKALVIFYPDCIEFEAILAAQVLHEEHLTIDVATPDGTDYHGPSGIVLRATHSYHAVDASEYRVVIVPGGDTKAVLENEALLGILTAAHAAGACFGAICGGPLLLARAGLLKGRRFTHGYGPNSALPYWKDGTYQRQPVVVDGNIVTAQPQAYIDFAIEVLYAAGLRDTWAVESMRKAGKVAEDRQAEIEGVKAHYKAIWGGG